MAGIVKEGDFGEALGISNNFKSFKMNFAKVENCS
jgi:hypothetical protein